MGCPNTFVAPLNGQNANGLADNMEVWKRAGDTNQGKGRGKIWGLPKLKGPSDTMGFPIKNQRTSIKAGTSAPQELAIAAWSAARLRLQLGGLKDAMQEAGASAAL